MSERDVPDLIRRLYDTVRELDTRYPGRHFTPDGHLVGSLGEAIVADAFLLELMPASTEGFDARAPDGRRVEIKATQRRQVGLQADGELPDHLIAVRIDPSSGHTSLVYNGPARPVWDAAGKRQKNGQRQVSLSKLRELMTSVGAAEQLPQHAPLP